MKRMSKSPTLNVTQPIIDEAERSNSAKCMIAQSARMMGARSVHVTAETISFNVGSTRFTYSLPAKAAIRLLQFDEGQPVAPFKLRLRNGFSRPVQVRAPSRRGPTRRRSRPEARRGVRRFHGLRVIEVLQPVSP